MGCGSFFALPLMKQTRRKSLASPPLLRLRSAFQDLFRFNRYGQRRWWGDECSHLLFVLLPLENALLLVLPPLQLAHALLLRPLLLPIFLPAVIAERHPQGEHRIDIFSFPAHSCSFEASLHDDFVPAFHHSRPNRPTCFAKCG